MDLVCRGWRTAARRLGLSYDALEDWGETRVLPRLSGVVDGYEVEVGGEVTVRGGGDEIEEIFSPPVVEVYSRIEYRVQLGGDPVWEHFSLRRADRRVRAVWPLRLRYLRVGDPEFDAAFAMRGPDADAIRLRFDIRRRELIRASFNKAPDCKVKDGNVTRTIGPFSGPLAEIANGIADVITDGLAPIIEIAEALTRP
jgi:hypothetical protein